MQRSYKGVNYDQSGTLITSSPPAVHINPSHSKTPNGPPNLLGHPISLPATLLEYKARQRSHDDPLRSPCCSTVRFRKQCVSSAKPYSAKSEGRAGSNSPSVPLPQQATKMSTMCHGPMMSLKLPPLASSATAKNPKLTLALMRDQNGRQALQSPPLGEHGLVGDSVSARFSPCVHRSNELEERILWSTSPSAMSSTSSISIHTPPLSPSRSRTSSLRSTSIYELAPIRDPNMECSPRRLEGCFGNDDAVYFAAAKPKSDVSSQARSLSDDVSSDDAYHGADREDSSPSSRLFAGKSNSLGREVNRRLPDSYQHSQPVAKRPTLSRQPQAVEDEQLWSSLRTPDRPSLFDRHYSVQTKDRFNQPLSLYPTAYYSGEHQQRTKSVRQDIHSLKPASTRQNWSRSLSSTISETSRKRKGDESGLYRVPSIKALSPLNDVSSDEEESALADVPTCGKSIVDGLVSTGTTQREDGFSGEIFDDGTPIMTTLYRKASYSERDRLSCRLKTTTHQCFSVVDGKWACYRRNYLKVDAAFDLVDRAGHRINEFDSLMCGDGDRSFSVAHFAIQLSSHIVMPTGEAQGGTQDNVPLVQFGPARERGPRHAVQPVALVPGGELTSNCTENEHKGLCDQTIAAFRRVQIRSATLNNGQRGSSGQQFYALKLRLLAYPASVSGITSARGVEVASLFSQPITVRGRSKMHYAPQSKASKLNEALSEQRRRQLHHQQQPTMDVDRTIGNHRKLASGQRRSGRLLPSSAWLDDVSASKSSETRSVTDAETQGSSNIPNRNVTSIMDIRSVC